MQARINLLLAQAKHSFTDGSWFASLAKSVDGLTAAQAAWVPAHGNSIWQIVNHVTFWKERNTFYLKGIKPDTKVESNDVTFGAPGDPADEAGWQAAVQRLHAAQEALTAFLRTVQDEDLDQKSTVYDTPQQDLLVGFLEHDAYHSGQIILLRKLQGWWPERS